MRLLVVAAWMSLAAPDPADACSIRRSPTACERQGSYTGFVGKVLSVSIAGKQQRATIAVIEDITKEKPLGKQLVVRTSESWMHCGNFTFDKRDVGKTYVVWAMGDLNELFIPHVSGTHEVRGKLADDEDVKFGRSTTSRKEALVEGSVDVIDGDNWSTRAGIEVVAREKPSIRAVTNADGKFTLKLPPGDLAYHLDIVSPGLYHDFGFDALVGITSPKQCVRPELRARVDGKIRGVVTGHDGKPVMGVPVVAYGDGWGNERRAYTAQDGSYEMRGVGTGTYTVGVSMTERDGVDPDKPYPPAYHGKPIKLATGGSANDIDLRVGKPLVVRTVSGTITYKGKPIDDVWITVSTPLRRGRVARSDERGRYSMQVVDGQEVTIDARTQHGEIEAVRRVITKDTVIDLTVP